MVRTLINFFIPLGSGQVPMTMSPVVCLLDFVGIYRQSAVLAFQYGDGFSNILWPTTLLLVLRRIAQEISIAVSAMICRQYRTHRPILPE